jgi:two-component system nitrogen regulation response regulator NtrX
MQDGKHVVLCIDDDRDIRDSLRIILEANGYIVVEAATAEEGTRVFQREHPDVIIVDLMMEEVDAGANFTKDLRLLGCKVPIFMLSSVGDSLTSMIDTDAMGLSGVLQKPISPDALLSVLKGRLG